MCSGGPGAHIIRLLTGRPKAVMEQLAELDIPLSEGPINHPTGTSLFIRDPDNNVIAFI